MLKRLIKILSLILILAIIISVAIAPIYADAIAAPIVIGGTALAIGGLAWAISSAMGVDFSMNNFTSSNIGQSFDPWYNVQSTLNTSDFTFVKAIRTGYDALKLSISAYNAIKEGSSNLITDNNIQDNSTGTIQSTATFNDVPLYTENNVYRTWATTIGLDGSGSTGVCSFTVQTYDPNNPNRREIITTFPDSSTSTFRYMNPYEFPVSIYTVVTSDSIINYVKTDPYSFYSILNRELDLQNYIDTTVRTYPYTSDSVNTSFGSTALDNITVIFPQTVLPSTASLDDILDAINELALENNQNVSVEIDVAPGPTPTPIPIPTTPLGDVPFDQFVDLYGQTVTEAIDNQTDVIDTYGQSVYGELESQTDALDAIGQSIDGIDSTITTIDTNVASSTGLLGQIKNGVQSLVNAVTGTISNTLSGILTEVQALVDEIVLSTETFVAGLLNTIPTALQTVWDTMKNAFSIWHYVVDWFNSVSGPFNWIWGIASGTSYYIVLPIYATLAGAVVLAFYKRFGK